MKVENTKQNCILAQILFAWLSWNMIEHDSIPVRAHGQKTWFKEKGWRYKHYSSAEIQKQTCPL